MPSESALLDRIASLETERAQIMALYEISQNLGSVRDENALLEAIAQPAIENEVSRIALHYIDANSAGEPEWSEAVASYQSDGSSSPLVGLRLHVPEFAASQVILAERDRALLIADTAADERVDANAAQLFAQLGTRALAAVPLFFREHWIGVIVFEWTEPHPFSKHEEILYNALLSVISPVAENLRMMKRLEKVVTQRTSDLVAFRALTDNTIDGVVMTDLQGNLTYANRAAHDLFGYDYDRQEMIGLPSAIGWPEDKLSILLDVITPAVLTAGGWRGEAPQKRKDGSLFDAQMTTFPIRDEAGNPIGAANILRDVTERKLEEQERERLRQQIIEAQQRAIQELSTPIIPIMDRIIVMPLIGSIDTMRSKDIMRTLLSGISDYRAQVIILDITGVPIVDSGVAGHLDKTIQAARLKGARTIITGVSDAVAEAIVDLGIDWSEVETLRDLQSGLIMALNGLGLKLTRRNEASVKM